MRLIVLTLLSYYFLIWEGESAVHVRAPTCIHEGFVWRQVKDLIHNGATQVWRCTKKSCNARAHSPVGTEELTVKKVHNHRTSATSIELIDAKRSLKDRAKTDSRVETRNLVADVQNTLSNDAATRLNSATAARMVQRARELPGRKEVDAKEIENVIIDKEV
uniref:FLYWCH-type domain-containing protein n=1 Tax=Panagrolaimus superbus TaxID=310955 RepID=A0A914YMS7_9BILA